MNPAGVSSEPFEARYTLPIIEEISDTADEILAKQERIRELCQRAQRHHPGASLRAAGSAGSGGLRGRFAAAFAERGGDRCRRDRVLRRAFHGRDGGDSLPGRRRCCCRTCAPGCSLAAAITADELRAWKARFPDAVVVSYINTSAEVKAESDYCCTSANAAKVVRVDSRRPAHSFRSRQVSGAGGGAAGGAQQHHCLSRLLPRAQHDSSRRT